MKDYLNHIPTEILEQILKRLNGLDLSKLKRINKKFNNSLDNPTAWRIMSNDRFQPLLKHTEFIDDNINWSEEMNRLYKHPNSTQIAKTPRLLLRNKPVAGLKVYKNHLVIDEYAPINIPSCVASKILNPAKRYEGFRTIGPYAGRIEPDPLGGHQIYDIFDNESSYAYKKIYTTLRGTLKSFNKTLAILDHPSRKEISIWNLSIKCKHTDEVLWKRSTKKKSLCDVCAYICSLSCDETYDDHRGTICSQIDKKLILAVSINDRLHVIEPLKGTSFDITRLTSDEHVKIDVESILVENPHDRPKIAGEQLIDIDGVPHHIVHCISNHKHRFYDLTARMVMAVLNCWPIYKWIPNTSYLAMAPRLPGRPGALKVAVVIDFKEKKLISRFSIIPDSRHLFTPPDRIRVTGMQAMRSSPILLISVYCEDYFPIVMKCSAVTGARLAVFGNGTSDAEMNVEVSDDEKTLIMWDSRILQFYDL